MKKYSGLLVLIIILLIISGCKKKQAEAGEENVVAAVAKEINVSEENSFMAVGNHSNLSYSGVESKINEPGADEKEIEQISEEVIEPAEVSEIENSVLQINEAFEEAEIEAEQIPLEEKKESEEQYVFDSQGKLQLFTYEDEILIPQSDKDFKILISSNKKITERKFYDSQNRFVKKEEWSIPDVQNAVLLKTQEYEYEDTSYKPKSKIIRKRDYSTYVKYDEFSNPLENKEVFFYTDEKNNSRKEVLLSLTDYTYDSEQRLIMQNVHEYEYTDKNYKKHKTSVKKIAYDYSNGKDFPPDYEYYEDDVLRLEKKYSNKSGNYIEKVYFSEGYCIETVYENNFKKKEIYTVYGVKVRETDYE